MERYAKKTNAGLVGSAWNDRFRLTTRRSYKSTLGSSMKCPFFDVIVERFGFTSSPWQRQADTNGERSRKARSSVSFRLPRRSVRTSEHHPRPRRCACSSQGERAPFGFESSVGLACIRRPRFDLHPFLRVARHSPDVKMASFSRVHPTVVPTIC
eukprot:scaffold270_cov347-Pavlova_lutheri.AAC.32